MFNIKKRCTIFQSFDMSKSIQNDDNEEFDFESFRQPDGGFGWVIVIAAFLVQFFVLGTMNNFGILFTKLLDEFGGTKQETSWVGSITYGLMFMSGPIATLLCERIGCRSVAIMGGIIGALGTLLASFSKNIFHMYLTEGLLFGVGASMCYFPSVIILPQYFAWKLSLANGLVSCGSGVGTMAMGPIINLVIENYGWRTSVRMSAVLMLLASVVSLLYKPLVPTLGSRCSEDRDRPLFDFTIFRNKAFVMFTFALFLFMLAYFVPFVHLTQMAVEYGVPMEKASLLIGFMSVSSTFGRLFFGKIADSPRINRLYVYQLSLMAIGVANTLCPLMTTFSGLLVYCTLFGFFEGCYVCQCAVLTGDLVGKERMAAGVGTLFGIKSIPLTLGPPLAGFLYDVSNSYQVAFYVAGAIPTIASCLMFAIPFLMPPPDDKFWNRRKSSAFSSQRKLLTNTSEDKQENNNNNIDKNNTRINNLRIEFNFVDGNSSRLDCTKSVSNTSITKIYLDVIKKVSMKDIGSVSSLGSILLTPTVKRRNTVLIDADRVTTV